MKTLRLNRKEAIDKIADELEIGSDARYIVGYTENSEQGRILYVSPTGQVYPFEYIGERTFRLIDLMPEPFFWDGHEDYSEFESDDDEYFERYAEFEVAAKDEIEAELLNEYKHDSLIDPDGEDVQIIWEGRTT